MATLRFARAETSLGPMWVAETDAGVAAVGRGEPLDAFLRPLRRRLPHLDPEPGELDATWIEAALSGGPLPPIDLRGLPAFDARVYGAVRGIPPGATATYGEVAGLVGSPGAARAVGGAMSRCPLFPAVPCHRVVRAADGWSGWGDDDRLKRRLLQAERPNAQPTGVTATESPNARRTGRTARQVTSRLPMTFAGWEVSD